jgi:hypothetical protein
MNTNISNPAHEILNQLGGRRFIMMTGSKNFFYDNNGHTIQMDLARNISGANRLRITLAANDTYRVQFFKVRKFEAVTVAKFDDVYCDMLRDIFTKVTGLYTSL